MKPFLAVALVAPFLLLSACASLTVDKSSTIGPYSRITARIQVMQPNHVWQAMLDWQSEQPGKGKMRIVHAMSGRIVELRWRHDAMSLRDNQAKNPAWHPIRKDELVSHGIVISPQELSEFLGSHIPSGFQPKGTNRWISNRNNNYIRVEWNTQRQRLIVSDIKHGYKAILIILKPHV